MGERRGRAPVGALLGILIAAPVVVGVVSTVLRLVAAHHPDPGWSAVINNDAAALNTGQGIYHDPQSGYAGMFFTPLFPITLAALFHIAWWEGWGMLLAIAAGLALAAMAARLALPSATVEPNRALRIAEAAGVGALAWSFNATLADPDLFQGRADLTAWALAIGGLLLAPRALEGSRRALAGSAALLTAALWTKQTTVSLVFSVVAVSVVWGWRHAPQRRAALKLAALLLALNATAVVAIGVVTHGWALRWTVGLATRFPVFNAVGGVTAEFARDLALVGAFLAVVLVQLRSRSDVLERKRPLPWLLLAAAAATAITGLWGRRLEGSSDHNFIGTVWCLALFATLAYRSLRVQAPRSAWLAVGAVAVTVLIPGQHWFALRRGDIVPGPTITETSPALLAYARSHVTYTPTGETFGAARDRLVYPTSQHLLNVIEGGYRPGFFLRALLHRRFDVVYPFEERELPFAAPRGAFEDNFLWKVNQVIEAKYLQSRATPLYAPSVAGGVVAPIHGFVPRAGRDPAPWMNGCFGPFRLGPATFDISRGGGFWCRSRAGLILRATPARVSEVVSRNPVASDIAVTLPGRRGSWTLRGGPLGDAQLSAQPARNGLLLQLSRGPRGRLTVPATQLRQTGGAVTLTFDGSRRPGLQPASGRAARVAVSTAGSTPVRLIFTASRDSGASIRLVAEHGA